MTSFAHTDRMEMCLRAGRMRPRAIECEVFDARTPGPNLSFEVCCIGWVIGLRSIGETCLEARMSFSRDTRSPSL